jgi:hypothetical protein
MTQIILILFVVLFFLGCFAQLIIYPFYWIIVYADIVYLSIIAFFVFIIVGFYVLKKYYRLDRTSIASLIVSGIIFLGYSAYFEAYFYIKKVAEEKYHTKPIWIKINLNKWTDFTLFGDPIYGSSHSVIVIDGIGYHWSFEKRDFVND